MKTIYYLGPKGSYSEIIAKKVYAQTNTKNIACNGFSDIVQNTLDTKDAVGVLPIENSITSNIHENMDYLFSENLTIVAESYLTIRLFLIGLKEAIKEDIQKVYSHPKALSQCRLYIREHNFATQETTSTAAAKEVILKINDKRAAAIGSLELANDEKLQVLDENIGDEKFNRTRFLFVSLKKSNEQMKSNNKASIMFTVPHKPGTLAKILTVFASAKLNLTKIESRPIPATAWEYQFWIDIESQNEQKIDERELSDILKKHALTYKIMGIYESGEIYE